MSLTDKYHGFNANLPLISFNPLADPIDRLFFFPPSRPFPFPVSLSFSAKPSCLNVAPRLAEVRAGDIDQLEPTGKGTRFFRGSFLRANRPPTEEVSSALRPPSGRVGSREIRNPDEESDSDDVHSALIGIDKPLWQANG